MKVLVRRKELKFTNKSKTAIWDLSPKQSLRKAVTSSHST